jgi:hypothetical protein
VVTIGAETKGTTMRKYAIAPIACCAVAVCIPGHASASPNDDSFLVALRDNNVLVPLSVDPIQTAQGVCSDRKNGQPTEEIARTDRLALFNSPAAFVDLAIEYYCPQYPS